MMKGQPESPSSCTRLDAVPHSYTIIKVTRDEDFREQIGKDIYFDLVDHDKVPCFRVKKDMLFMLFKEKVAKELGIPVQYQRFWLWAKRKNLTYRPNRPLTPDEEAQSVGQLREESNKANNVELKLFLEVDVSPNFLLVPPPEKTNQEILLFFKLYDPSEGEIRYVGWMFVKANGMPSEILSKLNELAGFAYNEEIELFEEIKSEPVVMCERIDKELNFRGNQLQDGDIICFQKSIGGQNVKNCLYPEVPSFLEYLHNCEASQVLSEKFRSLRKHNADGFCL